MEKTTSKIKASEKNIDSSSLSKNLKKALNAENPITLKIKKLDNDIKLPEYSTDMAVGLDVFATAVEYDAAKDNFIYHTSISGESDANVALLGLCRSSNCNTDCYLTNGIGLIDIAEYRGEIKFIFKNRTSVKIYINDKVNTEWILHTPWYKKLWFNKEKNYHQLYLDISDQVYNNWQERAPYKIGEKIGQFLPIRYDRTKIKEVKKLTTTKRGVNGFGSTGK